jgi:hypothetical protein
MVFTTTGCCIYNPTMRRIHIALTCLLLVAFLAACSPGSPAGPYQVISHPDGPLYVGDQVSFEVLAPAAVVPPGKSLMVQLDGRTIGSAAFGPYGLGARNEAVLWWAWDTRALRPGPQQVNFSVSGGASWAETFTLLPASRAPPPEPEAHWVSTRTACCILNYITGTDAARDLALLSAEANQQSASVSAQFDKVLSKPIPVYFMPRVLGQGGFTSDAVYLTYSDANYMGADMDILMHHEFVHYFDANLAGDYRPSLLQEGLAVYLSGGHYEPEPLAARGAALINLGWYIPLQTLADDFYAQQHEIGYLEAADLVMYLVDTYGWSSFEEFYLSIPQPQDQSVSAVINAALEQHWHISFTALETSYRSFLSSTAVSPLEIRNLQTTVEYFDAARRYQMLLDPSAYFMNAWLPDGPSMVQRGIVADLLRQPVSWRNQLAVGWLLRAHRELFSGEYGEARQTLVWINRLLDWSGY